MAGTDRSRAHQAIHVRLRGETDWKPGSPITWQGEFEGRAYQDKGEIISVEPGRLLEVTHFSPLTGQEDRPENYHRVRYDLQPTDGGTTCTANPGQQQQCRGGRAFWSQLANDARRSEESRRAAPDQPP